MMQLIAESKSLKRIQDAYQTDAGDCDTCKDFWKKLAAEKTSNIEKLTKMIQGHLE